MKMIRIKFTSFQIILMGFLGVILIGTFLLSLPISSNKGIWTPFIDALFTSTSAVCVTGLIVYDTQTYFNLFGQVVILLLIQIGGMGVVTVVASLFMLTGKKIGLFARTTMQDAINAPTIGGIVSITGFILKGIFIVELIGALIMMPVFIMDFGIEGIWMAIFHSISAFCNAGFDIMGSNSGEFSSLTYYADNPIISLTISLLIIIGGIGFLVWQDIIEHKFKVSRYRLQSKVALLVTLILIIFPTIYFFFFEFQDMDFKKRILSAIFQAVTPRTAGFNTVNLNSITEVGLTIMIILMLIGGSSGSTAGGMKTNTIAVLFASAISLFRKKDEPELLNRRIDNESVKGAIAVFVLYFSLFLGGGMIISAVENISMLEALYETASAVGTVGLTLGITQNFRQYQS